jgi:selenocysteine lyase/cysteine desulfurase
MLENTIKNTNGYREYFDLGSHHYLNCAYMGPLSKSTQREGELGIKRKANPKNLTGEHFFCHSEEIRSLYSELIHEDIPESIAIIPSVSYGMSIVANNVEIEPDQTIVLVEDEMPSNYYIWERLAREKNASLVVVDKPSNIHSRAKDWNEKIIEAISDNTAIVSLPHNHWLDGTLFDLEKISLAVHNVGGLLVVDGTQSIGALPFNNKVIQADAVICAGYKWLLGPYAISVAYFSSRFWDGKPLEEGWLNRKYSKHFERLTEYQSQYRPGAIRYDMGQSSNFINGPMLVDALKNTKVWTPEIVSLHCGNLTNIIYKKALELNISVLPTSQRAPHFIGLEMDNSKANQVKDVMLKNDISISVRNGNIRVTPHIYNDEQDINTFLEVLSQSINQ